MKTIAKLVLLLSLGIAGVSPAIAGPVCLNSYQVDRTTVLNAKTILFRMKNGTVWRNTLRTSCSGLLFNGFAYTLQTSDICDTCRPSVFCGPVKSVFWASSAENCRTRAESLACAYLTTTLSRRLLAPCRMG